jgi:hypothetical protein
MDLTDNGRYVVGAMALLVAGFALGSLSEVRFTTESALAILAGAATMLFLASRRGRNGSG